MKNKNDVAQSEMEKMKKPFYKKWWVWIVAVLAVMIIASMGGNSSTPEKDEYTVIFRALNGEEAVEVIVKTGELVEKPADPVKDGYTFSHWAEHEKSVDGSEIYDFSRPVTSYIGLFAHYVKDVEDNVDATSGYEKIFNDYSARLKSECPVLSITECAEIANEGISKMAKYMYEAKGTDGQYSTYETWASKLMDVYTNEAR